MRKIRNVNTTGNTHGYAGPVGGGHSSRSNPAGFSGADPPMVPGTIFNIFKKGLSILGVMGMLAGPVACANPTGGQTKTEDPTPPTDPTKPTDPTQPTDPIQDQKPGDVMDITFPDAYNSTMIEAMNQIKSAIAQLANQSQTITDQYVYWEKQLQESTGNVSAEVGFAETVKNTQALIKMNCITSSNAIAAKNTILVYSSNLADAICNLYNDTNAANLFKAQLNAFQMGETLNQREYYYDPIFGASSSQATAGEAAKTTAETNFANACAAITALNGQNIPTNVQQAIQMLRQDIETSLPEACGPYRNSFVQQWEDFAQFDGWTADLQILGAYMNISQGIAPANMQSEKLCKITLPEMQSAKPKTLAEIQAEQGLLV